MASETLENINVVSDGVRTLQDVTAVCMVTTDILFCKKYGDPAALGAILEGLKKISEIATTAVNRLCPAPAEDEDKEVVERDMTSGIMAVEIKEVGFPETDANTPTKDPLTGKQVKRCSRCDELLPLDKFYRQKDAKGGYMAACKKCQLKRVKQCQQKKAENKMAPR